MKPKPKPAKAPTTGSGKSHLMCHLPLLNPTCPSEGVDEPLGLVLAQPRHQGLGLEHQRRANRVAELEDIQTKAKEKIRVNRETLRKLAVAA